MLLFIPVWAVSLRKIGFVTESIEATSSEIQLAKPDILHNLYNPYTSGSAIMGKVHGSFSKAVELEKLQRSLTTILDISRLCMPY